MPAALSDVLAASTLHHRHLCPRQVLGARMGLWAGELLGVDLPQSDRRLLAIAETDGCAVDGLIAATGCQVGRRTLRVEDYGKVAATFVDTRTGEAVRLAPRPGCRQAAAAYAPEARNRWQAQLLGYQRMPAGELLIAQAVALVTPLAQILSQPGLRACCDSCGEEIINGRELQAGGAVLCRACALGGYCVPRTLADVVRQPAATPLLAPAQPGRPRS